MARSTPAKRPKAGAAARRPKSGARPRADEPLPVAASGHDIVVIGGSAGGIDALRRILRSLPEDLPASVFAVLHLSPHQPSRLAEIFQRDTPLRVTAPEDGAPIERGHVYLARPDCHLLVEPGRVRVVHGPKENRFRPAIDPLFRSAAWAYGPRVIGVILSGSLGDGAAGLWAVKTCGGLAVVQDPQEAAFREMPSNALMSVAADHIAAVDAIGPLLSTLTRAPVDGARALHRPEDLKVEIDFSTLGRDIKDMPVLGKPSPFTCPICYGSLWELDDDQLLRFRCHVGHAYSGESLVASQSEVVEDALYHAVRALEEQASASRRIGEHVGPRFPAIVARYEATARELDARAAAVRDLLRSRLAD